MMEASLMDIEYIVAEHLVSSWVDMNPKVYYKDSFPYGLLATNEIDGVTYIAACTMYPEQQMTYSMLKEVWKMIETINMCLITDDSDYIDHMKKTLERFNMRYVVEDGILYSFNDKET